MDNKVRIAVMGCASIADRSMIPAIKELGDKFELVGIASRTEDKAQYLANKYNCESIVGYDSILERNDIDAIYMPLPTGLHKEWIIKALRAGKHVYAEKSIAMNYSDCVDFINESRKNDCALMEGFMFQYHEQHKKVFDLIDSGVLGEIRHIAAYFEFPPFPDKNNFRYNPNIGGGALMDAAGYVVRAAAFLLRDSLKVLSSFISYGNSKSSIWGSAMLLSDSNIPVSVSYGFDNFYQCRYEIFGSKGKLCATKAFTPKSNEDTSLFLETPLGLETIVCKADNHFKNAMNEFYYTIMNHGREKHYNDILLQSSILEDLKNKNLTK